LTAEDFAALLAGPDYAEGRYELIDGEVVSVSPAGGLSSWVGGEVHFHLRTFVGAHRLGIVTNAEGGYRLGPDTVRAPDVAFVSWARLGPAGGIPKGFFNVAPDLAVEVISPSDRFGEVLAKARAWLAAGTRAVWVFSPEERTATLCRAGSDSTMIVLQCAEDQTLDGGDILPGFRLPLREVFNLDAPTTTDPDTPKAD
jgi:Uma2 family endonuclease